MRHLSPRLPFIAFLLGVLAVGPGMAPPALAASCGDGVGPCRCGDTVVTSTRLDGSDPVLKTPCPCDGLIAATGITLVIGGTIRAQANACSGIRLAPGSANVVVTTGRIVGFAIAVDGEGGVTASQVSRLQITDSGLIGILLSGDHNTIENNIIQGAGFAGIEVAGNANAVSLNRAQAGQFGIAVHGKDNAIARNAALGNGLDGFTIAGDHAQVDRNRSTDNAGTGFVIEGTHHAVTLNLAEGNLLDGLAVLATSSAFTRNRSADNGRPPGNGLGIADFTTDGGTGGTANTYSLNRCSGNGLGNSSPVGLCF